MKTLGEINIGDTFYILHYNGGYIVNVEKLSCAIITEIKIGALIKWIDKDGYVRGFTLQTQHFDHYDCTAAYCAIACADKERVIELLNEDKERFLNINNKCIGMI